MSNVNVGVAILVVANIKNEIPKILLGKRRAKKNGVFEIGECYALPGGKMESTDKSIYDAAIRELWEETGCTVCNYQQIDYFTTYLTKDSVSYVTFVLVVKHDSSVDQYEFDMQIAANNNCIDDEFESFNWYEFTNLPSPLFPPTQNALNIYMSGIDKMSQLKKGLVLI